MEHSLKAIVNFLKLIFISGWVSGLIGLIAVLPDDFDVWVFSVLVYNAVIAMIFVFVFDPKTSLDEKEEKNNT